MLGDEQAAVEGVFAWIRPGNQGRIAIVPGCGEVEAALLNPVFEVRIRDAIGPGEQRMIGLEESDRGFFPGHSAP